MTTTKTLLKKLSKKFPVPCGSQFQITGKDLLCDECIIRHDELSNGRDITFEDLKCSCYSYMFYETPTFSSVLPVLLKEFIQKNKFEIYSYIVDIFFKKMRNNELISVYSVEQKQIILDTLNYLDSLYFMEEFHIWDYEAEKLMHYYDYEEFYNYIHTTKKFWEETIGETQ